MQIKFFFCVGVHVGESVRGERGMLVCRRSEVDYKEMGGNGGGKRQRPEERRTRHERSVEVKGKKGGKGKAGKIRVRIKG